MKVKIALSNHHIHLNQKDFEILFPNQKMNVKRYINQPNQFVSDLKVNILSNDNKIEGLKIIGPCRNYTQVELLDRDAKFLNVKCPITKSGDLGHACFLTIESPYNKIIRKCGIIADRHLHLTKEESIKYGLANEFKIKLKKDNLIIEDVYLRIADNSFFEVHIDKEDGENLNINTNDEAEIIKY